MILLTRPDLTPAKVERDSIISVEPLGDGAVVYLKDRAPIRVMQSVSWIVALWKR